MVGGGTIKYYAGIVRQQPVELRKFAAEISGRCTLTTTDIYAVLESFVERMYVYLEEGRIVRLGELGSFSPAISSADEETPEEVDQFTINKTKVNFLPGTELRYRLSKIRYRKISPAADSGYIVE